MQQDNLPPLSETEIRALIADYLDGPEPDAEKTAHLQLVLAQYPEYMEEFTSQQSLRSSVSQLASQAQAPLESDARDEASLWSQISGQLKADRRAEVKAYDFEFLSAYYDGEIPSEEPEFAEFEAQLFHNTEANQGLADIGELSELVRQFGYRLEEACTVELTAAVMARYQAGEGADVAADLEEAPLDPQFESLSALYDQELSAKETIEWNARVESDDRCKQVLAELNELSEHVQRVSQQIQEQAPDLLPAVSQALPGILAETAKKPGLVLPFNKRVAIPVAAAAVLLLLFNVSIFQPTTRQADPSQSPLTASKSSAMPYEIATLPMAAPQFSADVRPVAFRTDGAALPDSMELSEAPKGRRVAAATVSPSYAKARTDKALAEIPSAEEYLFKALEQKVSADNELPLLLSDDTF